MMNKNPTLYDLVEFKRDHIRGTFVKVATHKTNVSKAIAYSEKKKIEFLRPTTLYTRFKIVKNGSYQYKNNFK